jgi:hypothetical protein
MVSDPGLDEEVPMSELGAYVWVVAGVVVAVVLPVLSAYIRKEFPARMGGGLLPPWVVRYLLLLLFGLIAGGAAFAVWRASNPDTALHWFTAFLIGFGAESALEKFLHPKP